MSWTFDPSNVTIYYIRILISDTNPLQPIFSDEEIMAAYGIQASMFQSSMFFSGPMGSITLPSTPVSYFRVAAILLDSMAAGQAFLSGVIALPDIKLNGAAAAKALQDKAQGYRDVEDNAGAFVILEQCKTDWQTRDRYWNQIQRQSGG